MEPTEQEAPAQEAEAQEAQEAHAAPEPKRRGRPPGSKNKPKQDVPTEPAAPKRKPKPPPLETPEAPAPVKAPAEAPAEAPADHRRKRTSVKADVHRAPQRAADAPVVSQDAPQLQLAAAAAEALPRTGGGAGLPRLVGRAQAGAGGAAAPGRREPADGGRAARAERRGVERAADEVAQQ